MNSFKQQAEATIREKERFLKEAIKIKEQLDKLPSALLDHDWGDNLAPTIWMGNKGTLSLSLYQKEPNQKEVESVKDYLGRELGFAFKKIRLLYDSPNFVYDGDMTIDDFRVEISIKNTPKPEGCTLIRKVETKEVEVFEAICNETGQKV